MPKDILTSILNLNCDGQTLGLVCVESHHDDNQLSFEPSAHLFSLEGD